MPFFLVIGVDGKCYNVGPPNSTHRYTQAEASTYCSQIDSILAEPENSVQNNYIKQILTNNDDISYWIGINDIDYEGRYVLEFRQLKAIFFKV